MMIVILCSVRDSAVDSYMRPFAAQSRGAAIRSFQDICVQGDSEIARHPGDYELFQVGEFDDVSGDVVPLKPVSLGRAKDFVKEV